MANYGTGITISAGNAVLVWQYHAQPAAIDNYATGGQRVIIGDSLSAFYSWDTGGSDYPPNPYGGFKNVAVDPNESPDDTVGSPTGTWQYFGRADKIVTGISKGLPWVVDAVRWGRCTLRVVGGDGADPDATFAGMAAANDNQTNAMWGLFQEVLGGYLWKGMLYFGYGGACVHTDSNVNIVVDDTPKVASTFNRIEIHNASSVITWDNVIITALGTQSRGDLEVYDDATLVFTNCQFVNLGTFIFDSNSDVLNCIFRECDQITSGQGDFSNTQVLECIVDGSSTDEGALVWDETVDPNTYTNGMSFTKGSLAHHAIEFGSSIPTTITLTDIDFSGFNASDGQYDSTLYFADSSGTITCNLSGCTGNISYKSAGCTVDFVIDPVDLDVHVQDSDGGDISGARVRVVCGSTGPWPYQESVSLSYTGGTVTVTHTGHGLSTNDKVEIRGTTDPLHRGIFQITVSGSNTYTYSNTRSPSASDSGTATLVLIDDTTDGSGDVSASRSYTSSQSFAGWARKTTSSPYYKQAPISGSIYLSDVPITLTLSEDE